MSIDFEGGGEYISREELISEMQLEIAEAEGRWRAISAKPGALSEV